MKVWRHKNCGGVIVGELWYSDAENDYHFPVCQKCQSRVAICDAELVDKLWYEFDVDNESINEYRDRRLRQMPLLSPVELEALRQLRTATWDGNLISKQARSSLFKKGLATGSNGWQVITQEGLAVLDTLGEMKA